MRLLLFVVEEEGVGLEGAAMVLKFVGGEISKNRKKNALKSLFPEVPFALRINQKKISACTTLTCWCRILPLYKESFDASSSFHPSPPIRTGNNPFDKAFI